MRSYGQYCSIAKALDVVGDRWTLLIIRELLIRGACRYTDLKNGLPGIATNLLSDRIRELESAGLIRRENAPPPIATTLFHLTEAGAELQPVLDAIGQWGVRYMVEPADGDQFRGHWFAFPASFFLHDRDPAGPPVSIELRTASDPVVIEVSGGSATTRLGTAAARPRPGRRTAAHPRPVLRPAHRRRGDRSRPGDQRRRQRAAARPAATSGRVALMRAVADVAICRSGSRVDRVDSHRADDDLDARLAGPVVVPQVRVVLRAEPGGEGVVII